LELQVVGELPPLVFELVQVQLLCLKLDPACGGCWWETADVDVGVAVETVTVTAVTAARVEQCWQWGS
jgi:hypothetical protein